VPASRQSRLMSPSASGAALIPDSDAPCAGGRSGVDRPPCWKQDRRVTPEQCRLRARIAANARWLRPMARADEADAARTAIAMRIEREADPEGQLPPDQRAALARAAGRRRSAQLSAAKARKRISGSH